MTKLRSALDDPKIVFTEAPGHATRLCREALDAGFEMVVAMGGDGTFNETANGFFEDGVSLFPDAVLGLIPRGTGGDFRRTAGIARGLEASLLALQGVKTRKIDVGVARFVDHSGEEKTRMFLNIASFGVSGAVDAEVNRSSKKLGGKISFALASLKALSEFEDQRVSITIHDESRGSVRTIQREVTTVAVCNGQFFGGGMWVAPKASIDDGRFDLTIWAGFRLRDFILKAGMIYRGTHLSDPRTTSLRCGNIEASSLEPEGRPVLIDLDGEQPGVLPASFDILPGALLLKTAS